MAGKSNYEKQKEKFGEELFEDDVAIQPKKVNLKDVMKKYNNEPMTATEFGVYLGSCYEPIKAIKEKTVRRYLRNLCEKSAERLHVEQFMETKNNKEIFLIKPEYHEILASIFLTDYFTAKGPKVEGAEASYHINTQIAENINNLILNDEIKNQIILSPQYTNARLEEKLMGIIKNELGGMIGAIYESDDAIRYQMMLETIDRLVGIRRWMYEWNNRINVIKAQFANTQEEKSDAENNSGLFKQKSLEDILIDVIAVNMRGEKYEYVTEDEEIFYSALYAAVKMYDITAMPEHELTKWLNQVDDNISNELRYQKAMIAAKKIFNADDQVGKDILKSFDKVVRSIIAINVADDLSPKQYERMVRFQEDSMSERKNKILCELEIPEFKLDEKTLKELIDIKDAMEERKRQGLL